MVFGWVDSVLVGLVCTLKPKKRGVTNIPFFTKRGGRERAGERKKTNRETPFLRPPCEKTMEGERGIGVGGIKCCDLVQSCWEKKIVKACIWVYPERQNKMHLDPRQLKKKGCQCNSNRKG